MHRLCSISIHGTPVASLNSWTRGTHMAVTLVLSATRASENCMQSFTVYECLHSFFHSSGAVGNWPSSQCPAKLVRKYI